MSAGCVDGRAKIIELVFEPRLSPCTKLSTVSGFIDPLRPCTTARMYGSSRSFMEFSQRYASAETEPSGAGKLVRYHFHAVLGASMRRPEVETTRDLPSTIEAGRASFGNGLSPAA